MEEILHQLVGSLSHYLQGVYFLYIRWCRISSINSMKQIYKRIEDILLEKSKKRLPTKKINSLD